MSKNRNFLLLWHGLATAVQDFFSGLEHQLFRETTTFGERPSTGRFIFLFIQIFLGAAICWWVYVPIHELLHAAGCLASGGEVTKLNIAARYGGHLLAGIFPFVEGGGDYAGRLSGFDTRGSDLCYLCTDFAPYLLTLLLGALVLRSRAARRTPLLFGAGLIFAFAPFMSLAGDFYEMGSICITRILAEISSSFPWESFRADDLFLLVETMAEEPDTYGISGFSTGLRAFLIVLTSFLWGSVLASLTYSGSILFQKLIVRFSRKNKSRSILIK